MHPMTPDELKRWRSATPIRFTHDEDGHRLTETATIATERYADATGEEELVLLDTDADGAATR